MFLKRQKEVSREFSEYIAENILNSQKVWQSILGGPKSLEFKNIVSRNVPLSAGTVGAVILRLQNDVGNFASHPLHKYTDMTLNLKVHFDAFLTYIYIYTYIYRYLKYIYLKYHDIFVYIKI
jgi:hypothetical protein